MDVEPTLNILNALVAIGFDNEAFWRLHHFRERAHKETIASFSGYCVKKHKENSGFEFSAGGTNGIVGDRLDFVLDTYRQLGLSCNQKYVFNALAEVAYFGIPRR